MDQEIDVVEVVEEIQFNIEVEITNEEIVVGVLEKIIITITVAAVAVISVVVEVVIHLINEIIIVRTSMKNKMKNHQIKNEILLFSFRQQRGRGNSIPGFNRRNVGGDKPTATVNHLINNYYML
jgi:hypothetical protein